MLGLLAAMCSSIGSSPYKSSALPSGFTRRRRGNRGRSVAASRLRFIPLIVLVEDGRRYRERALPRASVRGTASRGGYFLDWELRRPVGVKEPVGFLVGIRELRVTKSTEEPEGAYGVEKLRVSLRELLSAGHDVVSPNSVRRARRLQRNAAEF